VRRLAAALTLLLLGANAGAQAPAAAPAAKTSCIACHGNPDLFDAEARKVVETYAHGVHAAAGLSCQDCHGGNPDPALSDDPGKAMDEGYARNPFRGAPKRAAVPAFCGRCHSDATYMKRFNPELRVDQQKEYWTSRHGVLLKTGDTKVATCIDCHGVHGILAPSDPQAPVYPTQVAPTCAKCHGDPAHMAGYKLPDGRPLPIDQYALWKQSVHAKALLEKEDLSAPTCNDCHGNHGATPPGVDSIAFVCGQCHGREAELFQASAKKKLFDDHNGYLASAGPDGCTACHVPPEPAAKINTIHSFSECVTCHGNHGIVRPTLAMLAPLPETPCAFCHESPGPLASGEEEPAKVLAHYRQFRDALLAEAKAKGLEGEERFDWLIDRAEALPTHTVSGPEHGALALRPEFGRLFKKFRLGKTYYTYQDPATGKEARKAIVRCSRCHAQQPQATDRPVGYETSAAYLDGMRRLTGLTARAERVLLTARRGGVETRPALAEIDDAVDAQVQLEVLVHTFTAGKESPFEAKRDEGLKHAVAALHAGQDAAAELSYRRRGLVVALAFVVLVLIGLALKIRDMSQRSDEST
jgi:Cytochrome c7 and related cytochrome c